MCSKIGNVINKIFEEGNDMLSDIQIAQQAELKPIGEIAEKLGIPGKYVIPYGHTKAKIDLKYYSEIKDRPDGKLILVTATTPTPAGEGKTTTTIGLTQALVKLGKKAMLCLREPSLGPCFGVKGGAAGGGYSQVLPMEDINLHFTGDIHAVSTAHNLLAAMLDNHLQQGNELGIDPRRITFRRVVDMNDRALRNIVIGLGGKAHGIPRESGFDISVSSEIMAILCLATDLQDLKERLGNIVVGYTWTGEKVTARDLKAHGAMAALLKDAINPNLVQTIEHVPAFVHGGPFANIAHGTNSIVATKMALKLTDYTVVEAGFAADLGAEKFMDIVCRKAGFSPSAVVLVTTVRALKMHGGVPKDELGKENLEALEKGAENLEAHIDILKKFGVPVVVALNRFTTDTDAEIQKVHEAARRHGATIALSEVWAKGGEGGIELAKAVLEALDKPCGYRPLYELELHVPAFVHGGPFANIAHGTNSIVATKMALKLTDYTVVEAGFAADLGAEKFMDIVCRKAGFSPSAVVLVTTVRALKMHGGVPKDELGKENLEALEKGAENLEAHIDILKKFGVPVVVALNRFTTDTDAEIQKVHEAARRHGATIALSEVWAKGGEGGIELAKAVLEALDKPCGYRPLYELELPLREKIETIAREVYGADGVDYTPAAESTLKELEVNGYGNLPVCMAKTQMSISDDPAKKGRPKGYRITVREVRLSAGAGFIVPICGSIMTMPGLPKKPAAEIIDIDENGNILNLF